MRTEFSVMDEHRTAPAPPTLNAKLVLSKLRPGTSLIGARAPSVKMVLEGEELYQVEGRKFHVGPGQFLYLEGGADCIGINRSDTVGLCLMLAPSDAGSGQFAAGDPVFGRAVALSAGTSALGKTLREYGRAIARDPALGEMLASRIVAGIGRALADPLAESRAAIGRLKAAKPSTRRELYQRLERARGHLHDHRDRNVTLSELARVAGLSQFHLARYFKLAFGKAPIAYHRGLRLDRAADLLADGGLTVTEAAEAAGYSDATALSHAFRKHFGEAPAQWAMRAG